MNNNTTDKPISVTGNITPITHQPVGELIPHKWESPDVSLDFLNDQMNILQARYNAALSMRSTPPQMMQSLTEGLNRLNVVINNKITSQD